MAGSMVSSHAIELAPDAGLGPELRCPRCHGQHLHQGRVMVFDRGEDSELTAVTTVADGLSATHLRPSEGLGNPSARRQGLVIAFECEGCRGELELTIAQHKGNTCLAWRFEPPRTAEAMP